MNMITRLTTLSDKTVQWLWIICILLISLLGGMVIGFFGNNLFLALLAGLAGLVLLLISASNERFALYLLVASTPLGEFLRVGTISSTLLIIPGGLAVFGLLVSLVLRRHQLRIHFPIFIPALLLGLWTTISSYYNGGSLTEARPYWLVIVLAFLVPALLRSQRDLLRLCWVLVLSLGAAGLYVFLDRIILYIGSNGNTNANVLHNSALEIGGKDTIGLMLSLALPVAFYLLDYYRSQPWKRMWLFVGGATALAGALATLSVGTFIGLCAFIVLTIWMQDKVMNRIRYIVLGAVILVMALASPLAERLQTATSVSMNDASWGTWRMTVWESSLRVFSEHPFWGLGPDQERVGEAVIAYVDPTLQASLFNHNNFSIVPHNFLLSIAVENGVLGLLLYLAMLFTCFYILWSSIRKLKNNQDAFFLYIFGKILFIGLAIVLVQAMGLSAHLDKSIWLLFGCVGAYGFVVRDALNPAQGQQGS